MTIFLILLPFHWNELSLLRQQLRKLKKLGIFPIQNGTHVRLHSSVGLDGVELRLTKDNKSPHGMNVGDWDTVNSVWIAVLHIKENVEKALCQRHKTPGSQKDSVLLINFPPPLNYTH